MGQHPDGARTLAHDLGHSMDLQPGHDPQRDGLGLVGGQGGDQGERRLGRGALEGGRGRVIGCQGLSQLGYRQVLGWLAGGPPPVQDLMAGDGEHPGLERRLAALETTDGPDDPKRGR